MIMIRYDCHELFSCDVRHVHKQADLTSSRHLISRSYLQLPCLSKPIPLHTFPAQRLHRVLIP